MICAPGVLWLCPWSYEEHKFGQSWCGVWQDIHHYFGGQFLGRRASHFGEGHHLL